jgi:hypothetical protein
LHPHFVATAVVAFGRCPIVYVVDYQFVHATDATLSASYLLSLLLRPDFVAIAKVAFGHCPAPSRRHFYP